MLLDLVDAAGRDITAVQDTTALVVDGATVYVAYVDGGLNVAVASRPLAGGSWQKTTVRSGVADDAHNGASLGVDLQGYIWLAADNHDSTPPNIWRSVNPRDIGAFTAVTLGGVQPPAVSYVRFYRAGGAFYCLFRSGQPGAGDVYAKRWTAAGWVDLAVPLLAGSTVSPPDSAYLGVGVGLPNGDLILVWTHRQGDYNYGLGFARYVASTGAWTRADGSAYSLPITRSQVTDSPVPSIDATLSNVSLSVVLDSQGRPHVAFARHQGGYREIWHSVYSAGAWHTRQVTLVRAPRLRACPTGSQDPASPPRPCDMELMGPTMLALGDKLALFYARAVGVSRGTWARPPGALSVATSLDGGATWQTRALRFTLPQCFSEMPRESNGLPYCLMQETGDPSGSGPLWLGVVDASLWQPLPLAHCQILTSGAGGYAELPDADLWSNGGGFTISAWCRPEANAASMALVDKGGPAGDREFRLMLWAANPTGSALVYDPGHAQVLLGNGAGLWGLLWYPAVTVPPGEISHLVLTWDGVTVVLYLNAAPVAQAPYSGSLHNGGQRPLVGADRNAAGSPERFFCGWLAVQTYAGALDAAGATNLYDAGPSCVQ